MDLVQTWEIIEPMFVTERPFDPPFQDVGLAVLQKSLWLMCDLSVLFLITDQLAINTQETLGFP